MSYLIEYFEALERLQKGSTTRVPKGTPIANDTVSLEAGRNRGSIKKGRPIFNALITAIDTARSEQEQLKDRPKAALKAAKSNEAYYRTLWEEAMSREVSLVKQLWDERQEWAKERAALTGEKVTFLNTKRLRSEV